jgi:chemotaxis protein methyltransferase CheR
VTRTISDRQLGQLSDFVADRLGLSFPPDRWTDLERGILSATPELNFPDSEPFIHWLLSSALSRNQIEILASHLTVGETYFYRDGKAFKALENRVLPSLIRAKEKSDKRLRIWSAGCCTGEEAYTIAIVVSRAIPDPKDWSLTILATDINPRFLKKASKGLYGEWSFRDCPAWIREQYFTGAGGGLFQLRPEIIKMVRFAYVNLAEDTYPSLLNGTNAMDIIFCRNVLMYFTFDHMRKVVMNFHRSLVEGGWIFVSPGEVSHVLFPQFVIESDNGTILYRKEDGRSIPAEVPMEVEAQASAKESSLGAMPESIRENPLPASLKPEEGAGAGGKKPVEAMALLARASANQGKLEEAREWCEKAMAADRLDPELQYLRAMILQEQGQTDEAVVSLKRALYLDRNFTLAHFALGSLARMKGKRKDAVRHFKIALSILAACPREQIVPASEGMTAARLREIVESTLEGEGDA